MKVFIRIAAGGCALLALGAPVSGAAQPLAPATPPGITEWVFVSDDDAPGNNWSKYPSLSADGRYVVFDTWARKTATRTSLSIIIDKRTLFLYNSTKS